MVFPSWRTRRNPRAHSGARLSGNAAPAGESGCGGQGPGAPDAQPPCETPDVEEEAESLAFEIFVTRRFRGTVEAMSAARNALDRVKSVDEHGVPDHLPD